jgi:hypothetical protein
MLNEEEAPSLIAGAFVSGRAGAGRPALANACPSRYTEETMRRAALLAAIPVLAAVPRPCRSGVAAADGRGGAPAGVHVVPGARRLRTQPLRRHPRRAEPADRSGCPAGDRHRHAGGACRSAGAARADGGSAAPSSTFSTTNNQEEGVDEPDLVKTDGSTIYTVSGNTLFAVAVADGTPRIAGSLDLGSSGSGAQLFLNGNRLLVISQAAPAVIRPLPGIAVRPAIAASPYYGYGARTTLTEVDVHDATAPKVTQTLTVDGRFVDARQNGSTARLVIASAPQGSSTRRAAPRRAAGCRLASSTTCAPGAASRARHLVCVDPATRPVLRARDAGHRYRRLRQGARAGALGRAARRRPGGVRLAGSLYVATQRLDPAVPLDRVPAGQATVIDRFDVGDPDSTPLVGSGEVPGYLLNQFSLSEYGGYLQVATTSRPIWWGEQPSQTLSQSSVTVLSLKGSVPPRRAVSGSARASRSIPSVSSTTWATW